MSSEYRKISNNNEIVLEKHVAPFTSTFVIMIVTIVALLFQKLVDPAAGPIGMIINGFITIFSFYKPSELTTYSLFKKDGEYYLKNQVKNSKESKIAENMILDDLKETINKYHNISIVSFLVFLDGMTILIIGLLRMYGII